MSKTKEPPMAWAEELGRQCAERRAERQAQEAAEVAASGQRAALPAAELARRFAQIAVKVVEAVDAFGRAAAVEIHTEPGADLVLWCGADRLELHRDDETARVQLRAQSRGDAFGVALDDADFHPEPAARRIATAFLEQLAITHGGGANVHAH
jgi:hypothetical protein